MRTSSDQALELPPLPASAELLARGRNAVTGLRRARTLFHEWRGVQSQADYAAQALADRRLRAIVNIGLADWDATKEGLRDIWKAFQKEALTPPDAYMLIVERRVGLPLELRHDAPQETGPALWTDEDWLELGQVVPIQPQLSAIGSPASFENTLMCLRAGMDTIGNFCEFTWRWPYWDDEVAQLSSVLSAVGAMAALRDRGVVVDSYLEDGFAGEFEDYASVVGWSLLERYIVTDLCGAKYSPSFGGLTSDPFTRAKVFVAVQIAGGGPFTSSWYHNDTVGYGPSAPRNLSLFTNDVLVNAAAHLHFGWSSAILPVPLSEFQRVPSIDEIIEVHLLLRACEPHAARLADRIDWSETKEHGRLLAELGTHWFRRVVAHLRDCGVDTNDPLALMLGVRRTGRAAIEEAGLGSGERSFPTHLARIGSDARASAVEALRTSGAPRLDGLRVALVSTDVHLFAMSALEGVLTESGAQVIDCGVSADPERLAEECVTQDCRAIVVTTHNGWALNFGRRLMGAISPGTPRTVVMGGMLNEDTAGSAMPRDVSSELRALGVHTTNDVVRMVEILHESRSD